MPSPRSLNQIAALSNRPQIQGHTMHPFSIIVPNLGDDRLFDDTLASVLRYRPDDSQIIVVHDGSYHDPYDLYDEIDFVSADRRCQLPDLLEVALQKASGEYIALFRPGIELHENWHASVESSFENALTGAVSPIIETPRNPGKIVSAGVARQFGFRRAHVGTGKKISQRTLKQINPRGPSSWAAFYRRSALEQIGNLATHRLDPIYVDLDLALSLTRLGYGSVVCSDCIVSVERPLLVTRESTQSHGRSAQRAFRRHAAESGFGSTFVQSVGVFMAEVLSTPFRPWILQHAFQRLTGWTSARIDREFSAQLTENAQQKWFEDELGGLTIDRSIATQAESEVCRRAA